MSRPSSYSDYFIFTCINSDIGFFCNAAVMNPDYDLLIILLLLTVLDMNDLI